jgi:hypothetical protein
MKKLFFNISFCFLVSVVLLSNHAQAQKKGGKVSSKIVGTWILQKLDAVVREEHKNNPEAQKMIGETKSKIERESNNVRNAIAFTFQKDGKLLVNFADMGQNNIQATWKVEKDVLLVSASEKSFETDLNNSKVFFEGGLLYIGMVAGNGVSNATPLHMICFVFKKGSTKDLTSSTEIRKKPPVEVAVPQERAVAVYTKNLIIGAKRVPCQGEGKQECLQMKENESDTEWQYLYENIEGFEFEEGYLYHIQVQIMETGESIPDKSNKTYKLLQTISKQKEK